MFKTLAESETTIEVTVGDGRLFSAAIDPPVVVEIPLQHCAGMFAACEDCEQVYVVTQIQSGTARQSFVRCPLPGSTL